MRLRPAVEHKPYTNGRPTQQVYLCKTCGDGFVDDGSPTAGPGGGESNHGPGVCGNGVLRFNHKVRDYMIAYLMDDTPKRGH